MKTDIKTLQDTFKISYDAYKDSIDEALEILDNYHNRQYNQEQLNELQRRGQPAETFNVIKLFTRMLIGYYSTIVNNIKVKPKKMFSIYTAAVLQDSADYVFRTNNFDSEGDKIKLDCILTGLMCSYVDVVETGETDEFGRPLYDIKINHIPSLEILLDPMSRLDDYSDFRWIHRYKWVDKSTCIKLYGKEKVNKLEAYYNNTDIKSADFVYQYNNEFRGKYKVYDNYLVIHTIIIDDEGRTWSIHWSGDTELSRKEITYKEVKNPYRVQKLNSSNKTEFYGLYREILESQKAINQALLKIQIAVNTNRVFYEEGAVDDIDEFKDALYRVNSVIPVLDLNGIKVDQLTREIVDQYTIIDKALDRIQRVLSINDSFLGMAYASDSGKKVQLQQNASAVAQRYATSKIEKFYRLLGIDICNLIKQYYTAHDIIRVSDEYQGDRWVELNAPLQIPTGRILPDGTPETRLVFEEVLDPATNEPMINNKGELIMAPIPTAESDISFTRADIEIDTVAYSDNEEKDQAMLDSFLNGPLGQMLSQTNPAGYFKAGSLAVKNVKSKYSLELSAILNQTAQMLSPEQQQMMQNGQLQGQMPMGQSVNQLQGRPSQGNA
jgi:hypothetical protein